MFNWFSCSCSKEICVDEKLEEFAKRLEAPVNLLAKHEYNLNNLQERLEKLEKKEEVKYACDVKEELPPCDGQYYAYVDDCWESAYYDGYEFKDFLLRPIKATHWMPYNEKKKRYGKVKREKEE